MSESLVLLVVGVICVIILVVLFVEILKTFDR